MSLLQCPECTSTLATDPTRPSRIKHNADGSHTLVPATPPKALTDPKPRGRRRG